MKLRKLTQKQQNLLDALTQTVRKTGEINTTKFRASMGDFQAYDTCVCSQLFTLARRGLVTYREVKAESGRVMARYWNDVE